MRQTHTETHYIQVLMSKSVFIITMFPVADVQNKCLFIL